MDTRPYSNRAFCYLAPALAVMTFCGIIPMGFVMFYSLHDTFAGNSFYWVGLEWFREVLTSRDFLATLGRSFSYSALVLIIEIPLGIFIALRMPASGTLSRSLVVLMAIPLLTPTIVVGYLWRVLVLPQAGLLGVGAAFLGFEYDMNNPLVTWITLALMDMWHWTSLVVLLCFAGLRAIPDAYYQAAQIDGASPWAVFRYVQLPKLRLVLMIAVMLRFMDSFIIYAEAYILTRGGGPDRAATFLSQELVQVSLIQFDLGRGGAMAVIFLAIVLCISWVFFSLIVPKPETPKRGAAA